MPDKKFSRFRSEITVRPDDIDVNNHVHFTKYLDYVLAARYMQMREFYKMSMEEFWKRDLTWVVSDLQISFKRELRLEDVAVVETGVNSYNGAQCLVDFIIYKKEGMKVAAEGHFNYTMLSLKSGRPVRLPEDIIQMYSI
ncbi:MAG: acyl-CoA thioesterase [Ignavibacteriaceae bacterium]|nr:acyl-CoA thioesterase [Ignavibacteriaceae bacterium]